MYGLLYFAATLTVFSCDESTTFQIFAAVFCGKVEYLQEVDRVRHCMLSAFMYNYNSTPIMCNRSASLSKGYLSVNIFNKISLTPVPILASIHANISE